MVGTYAEWVSRNPNESVNTMTPSTNPILAAATAMRERADAMAALAPHIDIRSHGEARDSDMGDVAMIASDVLILARRHGLDARTVVHRLAPLVPLARRRDVAAWHRIVALAWAGDANLNRMIGLAA